MPEKVHNRTYLKYEDLTQDKQQVNANFRLFIDLNKKMFDRVQLQIFNALASKTGPFKQACK